MQFPEGLENTPFKQKIFSNFVAFSEYPNFNFHTLKAGGNFKCDAFMYIILLQIIF